VKRRAGSEKGSLENNNWRYAYVNRFDILAKGIFRLEAIFSSGKMNLSGNLSFTKRTLVGWMSGC
jgi:hypothetical protein